MTVVVPIKYVIAAATLVSTFSSMAGGLLMYFEGLKSLEETVAETSASEVDGIKSDLMSVVTTTTEVANQLIFYSHSKNVVHGHTDADADAYTKLLHAQQYAVVRGSGDDLASVGIAVVQHDQFDPNNQYTNVFRAPLQSGKIDYLSGVYARHLYANGTGLYRNPDTGKMYMKTRAMSLFEHTGDYDKFKFNFDTSGYLSFVSGFDATTSPDIPAGWTPAPFPARAIKFRTPRVWQSADKSSFGYGGIDLLVKPPPAPHPWHKARVIVVFSLFLYDSWAKRLQAYHEGKADTKVIIYDKVLKIVYASTEGTNLLKSDGCLVRSLKDLASRPPGCAYFLHNTSAVMQEAYNGMLYEDEADMHIKNFDGTKYFARKMGVINDVEILWMRPTSSVEGKVRKALNLLIVFTLLVLVFDTVVSILEMLFVALPMKRMEATIELVGSMQTEEAMVAIAKQTDKPFLVKEIKGLLVGMAAAANHLHELREFMPQSVLCRDDDDTDDSRQPKSSLSHESSMIHVQDSRSVSSCHNVPVVAAGRCTGLAARKAVTVACFNIKGFHACLKKGQDAALKDHQRYVEEVMTNSRMMRGIVDELFGDRISVSFNTVMICGVHEQNATMMSLRCTALTEIGAGVNAAICTGPASVGNVGCVGLKKFAIFGPLVAASRALVNCATAWESKVLCNFEVAKTACSIIQFRHVIPARLSGKATILSEAECEVTAQDNQEWMYQLSNAESANPHANHNRLIEGIHAENVEGLEGVFAESACPVAKALYTSLLSGKYERYVVGGVTPRPGIQTRTT